MGKQVIGSFKIIVEIDETKLVIRKGNGGRIFRVNIVYLVEWIDVIWIVFFIKYAPTKKRKIWLGVISRRILTESIIFSD